ncbi:hypothetical protein BDA96_03G437900 [Sorghum bicolor]|uniref:Uncharacterized protein n=2 Tax=Sorghum bicolor TaxID=4558 RepID=A0A921RJ61_SORBI|nr:hypothetical protein BDA96_03G437900 [Sorghum bicolor]OQU88123.1 hypothetical protein SORBI_3003G406120 [Sorghum bicolor]
MSPWRRRERRGLGARGPSQPGPPRAWIARRAADNPIRAARADLHGSPASRRRRISMDGGWDRSVVTRPRTGLSLALPVRSLSTRRLSSADQTVPLCVRVIRMATLGSLCFVYVSGQSASWHASMCDAPRLSRVPPPLLPSSIHDMFLVYSLDRRAPVKRR